MSQLKSRIQSAWQVGAQVQAIFSADGQFYDAVIKEVSNDDALVVFEGFDGSEEWVKLESLQSRLFN